MNLLQLCEPLFSCICRLNRLSRSGKAADYDFVRSDIKACFALLAENARSNASLAEQYKQIELPLFFFVDSIIAESALPFASLWNQKRLGYERNELAGDEKFFDLLDETLAEEGTGAGERLAVFYSCIGLGFSGWYQSQPEYLRKQMNRIAQRIPLFVGTEEIGLLTPDAYQHTNTVNLPLPLSESLAPLLLVFVGFVLLVGGVNYYLFRRSSAELHESLNTVLAHAPARITGSASTVEITR